MAILPLGGGEIALSPAPGQDAHLADDLDTIAAWQPACVLSLTEPEELSAQGVEDLPGKLRALGVEALQRPIRDFSPPDAEWRAAWPALSRQVREWLGAGQRVLVHCRGGCGRSGMVVLRLMIEAGEAPDVALARLRSARPCAVETPAQLSWATSD